MQRWLSTAGWETQPLRMAIGLWTTLDSPVDIECQPNVVFIS
ncbi:MAG: hypothetical protein OXP71_05845 [Candidatus Poribacteria bacterium]|nr:hypothetical protein [Candidatus Poribacteria bacterium]